MPLLGKSQWASTDKEIITSTPTPSKPSKGLAQSKWATTTKDPRITVPVASKTSLRTNSSSAATPDKEATASIPTSSRSSAGLAQSRWATTTKDPRINVPLADPTPVLSKSKEAAIPAKAASSTPTPLPNDSKPATRYNEVRLSTTTTNTTATATAKTTGLSKSKWASSIPPAPKTPQSAGSETKVDDGFQRPQDHMVLLREKGICAWCLLPGHGPKDVEAPCKGTKMKPITIEVLMMASK